MGIPIEEVKEIFEELKALSEQEQRIDEQTGSLHQKLITVLARELEDIYRGWNPKMGEKAVVADFSVYPPVVDLFFVTSADANGCSLAKNLDEKHAFVGLSFDDDVRDYMEPHFVLPLDIYKKMSKAIGLKEIS